MSMWFTERYRSQSFSGDVFVRMMLSKRLAIPSFSQISSHQLDVTKFPNHLDTNEVKKGSIYSQETMDKLGIFRNIRMI